MFRQEIPIMKVVEAAGRFVLDGLKIYRQLLSERRVTNFQQVIPQKRTFADADTINSEAQSTSLDQEVSNDRILQCHSQASGNGPGWLGDKWRGQLQNGNEYQTVEVGEDLNQLPSTNNQNSMLKLFPPLDFDNQDSMLNFSSNLKPLPLLPPDFDNQDLMTNFFSNLNPLPPPDFDNQDSMPNFFSNLHPLQPDLNNNPIDLNSNLI